MNRRSAVLQFLRRSWDTVTLAGLLTAFLIASLSLGRGAAWIPRIVLVIALALTIVQLVIEARAQFGRPRRDVSRLPLAEAPTVVADQGAQARSARSTHPVEAAIWIIGLMLAMLLFGTSPGSALFCLAYLRWHAHEEWLPSIALAALLGVGIQLVFGVLMNARLHGGLLWSIAQ